MDTKSARYDDVDMPDDILEYEKDEFNSEARTNIEDTRQTRVPMVLSIYMVFVDRCSCLLCCNRFDRKK